MKTPFVECDGQLYIKAKQSGIQFLCLLCDGIPITQFGKSKTPYLRIEDAIVWHESEIKATNGKWGRSVLDTLIETHRRFVAGQVCDHI